MNKIYIGMSGVTLLEIMDPLNPHTPKKDD